MPSQRKMKTHALDLRSFPALHHRIKSLGNKDTEISISVQLISTSMDGRDEEEETYVLGVRCTGNHCIPRSVTNNKEDNDAFYLPYVGEWVEDFDVLSYRLAIFLYTAEDNYTSARDYDLLTLQRHDRPLLDGSGGSFRLDYREYSGNSIFEVHRFKGESYDSIHQARRDTVDLAIEKIPLKTILLFSEIKQMWRHGKSL